MKNNNYLKFFTTQLNVKFMSLLFVACIITPSLRADRIYMLPGTGYNEGGADIIAAISSLGHTVVSGSASATTLPAGFTSTCIDPVNGYDYLCLFGTNDYTPLTTQIKAFIDVGGKVYFQHEVSCCVISATGAAAVASSITGLTITPNIAPYIALGGVPAWESVNLTGCANFEGNAYKCMDGVPPGRTLDATANIGTSAPPYTDCENFGMYFTTTDFTGTAHNGAFVAVGDVNIFYDGAEPPNNGGTTPVNMDVINYFFPVETSSCFLFTPGCVLTTSVQTLAADEDGFHIYSNQHQLVIEATGNFQMDMVLMNSIGQDVLSVSAVKFQPLRISTSQLSKGIYFVKILRDKKVFVKKVFIQN